MEFEDSRDADDAVYELNGKDLCGERVIVEHARGPRRDRDGYSYGSRSESQPRALRVLGTEGGVDAGLGGGRGGASQPRQAQWAVSFDSGVSGPRCLRACPVQTRDAGARGLGCGFCLARVWVCGRFLLNWEVGGLCWAPVSTVVNSTYRGSEG